MAGPDRRAALIGRTDLTGIDFVAVHPDQVTLDVFFLNEPDALVPPLAVALGDLSIAGDDPVVAVTGVTMVPNVEHRTVLRVVVDRPGGWGTYELALATARIDPYFAKLAINFKGACPRDVDCAPPPHVCASDPPEQIVVDGTARDFWSLQRALLEFANLRNPRWQDRLPADVGVMVVELLAALGDELAYYQDRVGREAQFDSATQRRSVRRHVRLLDYDLDDGAGATGWLAIDATATPIGFQVIPAGTAVYACSDRGRSVGFSFGTGLRDAAAYRIHVDRNKLFAHVWEGDDEPDPLAPLRPLPQTCLAAGSTAVHVDGAVAALFAIGESVFLTTEPPIDQRDAPRRRVRVVLTAIAPATDPLGASLGIATDLTRLEFTPATPFDLDLSCLVVRGNVAPITAGVTETCDFTIGADVVERVGPGGVTAYLQTLPGSATAAIVRLRDPKAQPSAEALVGDPRDLVPELLLVEKIGGHPWKLRSSLIGSNSAEPGETVFTLDDGTWARAVGYQRIGGEVVHVDYVKNEGATIRFGDGEFGAVPSAGLAFRASYRLGNGSGGNLPANAIRCADPTGKLPFALGFIAAVTNPLPTSGGVEAETIAQAKRDAPQAFRAQTFRAVRPEDYDQLAELLPWVQRAGTQFRWTGSWLSAFTTADPAHVDDLPTDRRVALARYLDRYRMAGREVRVLAPRYADLDLGVRVCVVREAYASDVRAAVARALAKFFDPDHFTFGTPLDRSALETAVQRVPGVRAVERLSIGRRGHFHVRPFAEPAYRPGLDEVIRVENSPVHPDRGSYQISSEGGA